MSDIKPQIQEAWRKPSRIKKKSAARNIIFKLQKIRDKLKILKEARGKIIFPVEEPR